VGAEGGRACNCATLLHNTGAAIAVIQDALLRRQEAATVIAEISAVLKEVYSADALQRHHTPCYTRCFHVTAHNNTHVK